MSEGVRRPRVALWSTAQMRAHGRHTPVRVVIHDTESHDAAGIRDINGILAYWRGVSWGPGAHLIIDADGNTAAARMDNLYYHTEGRNTGSIGIELIGFARFTPRMWFLRIKQLRECAKWLAWLNYQYGIPLRFSTGQGVSGHRQQSERYGGSHWDPGYSFPFGFVLRLARRYRKRGWK